MTTSVASSRDDRANERHLRRRRSASHRRSPRPSGGRFMRSDTFPRRRRRRRDHAPASGRPLRDDAMTPRRTVVVRHSGPLTAGLLYVAVWIAGLLIWPSSPGPSAAAAQIADDFGANAALAATQFMLVEGVAAVALAYIVV